MNKGVESLRARFFADAQEYLSRGKEIVERLAAQDGKGIDAEEIHELFRCVHSVKSEASYLKYAAVGRLANALEEKLETIRSGKAATSASSFADIEGLLNRIMEAVQADKEKVEAPSEAAGPVFNNFERKLLEEATRRDERCYRVVFELEQEAPMKQARAYLILSNLEQISTVVKTVPAISTPGAADGGENDEISVYTCYLTASVAQSEIHDALDVDQVARSRIDLMEFEASAGGAGTSAQGVALSGAAGGTGGRAPRDYTSFYRLTGKKLAQLTAYADDLRLRLRELELDMRGDKKAGAQTLRKINRIAGGLYEELKGVRTATFGEEYQRYKEIVDNLAQKLGKRVRLKTEGGDLTVDRRTLAALSDPLGQLLRNAVDHGIEPPAKRRTAGKDETGTVSIVAREDGETLRITVSDDGAGVDEKALRRQEEQAGNTGSDLFAILSRPGFTTVAKATDYSGRGVGLDLVARRVEEIGGRIRATAKPGKGMVFEISVPKGPSSERLLFFRFGSKLYAMPAQAVAEVRRISKGELRRNSSGRVFYTNLPAYAADRPARVGNRASYGSFALLISYLGRKACVLADDVLFEHEVSEDLFSAPDENREESRRMAVGFGSERREFTFLPPAMIHPEGA
ncbi:MAG: Hpt domain-containing protein [Spirochaetales bacterium]|nr:Hpt domain-containing protein [Spirochaetales bacterium]